MDNIDDSIQTLDIKIPGHPEAVVKEDLIFWYIDNQKFFKSEYTLNNAIQKVYPQNTIPPESQPVPPPFTAASPETQTQPYSQPIPQWNVQPPTPHRHKASIAALAIVGALLLLLLFTCPKENAHKEKIGQLFTEYMQHQAADDNSGFSQLGYGIAMLLKDKIISSFFTMDDYGIFSIGKITYNGNSRPVTFGILNIVIPLVDVKEAVESAAKYDEEATDSIGGGIDPSSLNRLINANSSQDPNSSYDNTDPAQQDDESSGYDNGSDNSDTEDTIF